jgi:hypothetical protein
MSADTEMLAAARALLERLEGRLPRIAYYTPSYPRWRLEMTAEERNLLVDALTDYVYETAADVEHRERLLRGDGGLRP